MKEFSLVELHQFEIRPDRPESLSVHPNQRHCQGEKISNSSQLLHCCLRACLFIPHFVCAHHFAGLCTLDVSGNVTVVKC